MELKHLVLATAAVFSAGALAAGDYSSPPQRQSESQGAMPESQSRPQRAQAQSSGVVKQVQQELKQKGFDAGPVDGRWGPMTEKGVKQFQKSQNIQASGQLDERTLAALGIQEPSSATGGSRAGSSGPAGAAAESAGSASGTSIRQGAGGSPATSSPQSGTPGSR
jgi:peptidoglycan hydrolase-like protein with peptidoglycan-binding domain